MMAPLQRLIESLRHELHQNGEMLALLDQQNQSVQCQSVTSTFEVLGAIQSHRGVLIRARQIRQESNAAMARSLGQSGTLVAQDLIPLLPHEVRPLISALLEENGALQGEIVRNAQRNQLLLRKSADLMEDFIQGLNSQAIQKGDSSIDPENPDIYEAIA